MTLPSLLEAVHTSVTVLLLSWTAFILDVKPKQEAQLSPSDSAMRLVSSNLASCHATVQKLLIRRVLTKLMV